MKKGTVPEKRDEWKPYITDNWQIMHNTTEDDNLHKNIALLPAATYVATNSIVH
jgi:hypothetical protein